ncbi:hypothetical protein [Staphylococcus pseudoxylosus]
MNDNKKNGCIGCLGCLGCLVVILLIVLLVGGCSAFFYIENNSDSTKKET